MAILGREIGFRFVHRECRDVAAEVRTEPIGNQQESIVRAQRQARIEAPTREERKAGHGSQRTVRIHLVNIDVLVVIDMEGEIAFAIHGHARRGTTTGKR